MTIVEFFIAYLIGMFMWITWEFKYESEIRDRLNARRSKRTIRPEREADGIHDNVV